MSSDQSLAPKRSTVHSRTSRHITKRDSGIRVDLSIDVQSSDRVLAHLQVTNLNQQNFWLYKPLIGSGKWERIFAVQTNPERHSFPYVGPHTEKYENDDHTSLIVVHPREEAANFVILVPGETYTVTLNLSEVYDFVQHPGEYFVVYSVSMPAMQEGRQQYGVDPLDSRRKRIYYALNSVKGPSLAERYVPITVV